MSEHGFHVHGPHDHALEHAAHPHFSPQMGEDANPILPSLSFPFLPYFILAHLYSLNAWTDFYV